MEAKHCVVNLVNFVRGAEPRNPSLDLTETTRHEIELHNKYGFPNTVLLQYDALHSEEILQMLDACDKDKTEFGIWFEFCESLIRACSIEWHGRPGYSWDYYVNPAFCFAYTKEQKLAITDECMRAFWEKFGAYPKSVGAWLLDSDTVSYMKDRYGVEAFCICREQWGTDGYTLWGGYYNGPYYPSKQNLFTPAQSRGEQIDAPVFRMLGADPIYCYMEHFGQKYNGVPGGLFTLEPTWACGQSPDWVDWYFDVLTEGESLSYAYTQTGQENNFPWDTMTQSLPMQYEKVNRLWKCGKITLETMGESGARFRRDFSETPPAAMSALRDWAGTGRQSVWYSCKNYRANLFRDGDVVLLRDLHKFDESVRDPYLDTPATGATSYSDNLPLVDGLRFSSEDVCAGLYIGKGEILSSERQGDDLRVTVSLEGNTVSLLFAENGITFESQKEIALPFRYAKENPFGGFVAVRETSEKGITYSHNGKTYTLHSAEGSFDGESFRTENKKLILRF